MVQCIGSIDETWPAAADTTGSKLVTNVETRKVHRRLFSCGVKLQNRDNINFDESKQSFIGHLIALDFPFIHFNGKEKKKTTHDRLSKLVSITIL